MPFWKKSEDPWDWEPEQRPPSGAGAEQEDAPGILDELRDWNAERKERRNREDAPPPPMVCPWCGQAMALGYLFNPQGAIWWTPDRPNAKSALLGPDLLTALRVDDEGGSFISYKTAWYCTACEKLVVEAVQPEDTSAGAGTEGTP